MKIAFSDDLTIVLVEPQNPGNIGMVCRAMANFGVSDLRLVNPCQYLHPEARKFAVAANHLLGQARVFADLPAAIADLHVTIATTRRSGRLRGELLDIAEVPALRRDLPLGGRMGLVFGREDVGLTSDEVAQCSHAATVATSLEVGSINLAQAVLLFVHELTRHPSPMTPAVEREAAGTGGDRGAVRADRKGVDADRLSQPEEAGRGHEQPAADSPAGRARPPRIADAQGDVEPDCLEYPRLAGAQAGGRLSESWAAWIFAGAVSSVMRNASTFAVPSNLWFPLGVEE